MKDMMFLIVIANLTHWSQVETTGIAADNLINDLKSVVFPVPLSPITATCSPRLISK